MAYNFTVPERLDISRPIENVHIRIKSIAIFLENKSIEIEVLRVNQDDFSMSGLSFSIIGDEFRTIIAATPSGANLYDAIKTGAWNYLIANHSEQLSFNGRAPLDAADTDGTLFESTPSMRAT